MPLTMKLQFLDLAAHVRLARSEMEMIALLDADIQRELEGLTNGEGRLSAPFGQTVIREKPLRPAST